MRLCRLSIDRFGHFTDKKFDFGAVGDKPDFHIIYGPNESGKTTAMEAVMRLFYGFLTREDYDFKHSRNNLQVSGVLEIDGSQHHFTRLPTRSGSLVDTKTNRDLPEKTLATHLAGLSKENYHNLFYLNDETIVAGGEEIVQARGDIGQLLFSAATGMANLSTVLDDVREKADDIWRKRASKTRAAKLKSELNQVESEIRDLDTSVNEWRKLKKTLDDAYVAERNAKELCDAKRKEFATIEAKRRAVPLLAKIDELTEKIAPYTTYPENLDFDPETLVKMITEEGQVKADIDRLTGETKVMETTLSGITHIPELVTLSGSLDELGDLHARNITADKDLDTRHREVSNAKDVMARAAQDLGVKQDVDPRRLALSPAQIKKFDNVREELRKAGDLLNTEAGEVADLTKRRDEARAALEDIESKTTVTRGISDILAQHDADRLAIDFATARQAINVAEAEERSAVDALTTGNVRFEALPNNPTSLIKVQGWVDTHTGLVNKIEKNEENLEQQREDDATHCAKAEQLMSNGNLVSDADAAGLQAERDELWKAHQTELSPKTAQSFEKAMQALDVAMQSRVDQGSDLGQLRQIEQDLAGAQARVGEIEKRLAKLRKEKAEIEDMVNKPVATIGLSTPQSPLEPMELLDWVQRHNIATEASQKLAQVRDACKSDIERGDQLLEALRPALGFEPSDFDSALAAARTSAEAEREAIAAINKARDELDARKKELTQREQKRDSAQEGLEQAKEAWCSMVSEAFGDLIEQETLFASLDPLRVIREHDQKCMDLEHRIEAMESDQKQFTSKIEEIAAALNIPMSDTATQTFSMLRERSDEAKKAEEQEKELTASIKKTKDTLVEKKRQAGEITIRQEAMGRIFPDGTPVATLDELRRAAMNAQQVIVARSEKSEQERAIFSELGVSDLDTVRTMLEGATLAALEEEAKAIKFSSEEAARELTRTTEERVSAKKDLDQVTGGVEVATLTERKITIELELEEAALEYLKLSLGHKLADEAIRRYRDAHRSGMMKETEHCFALLTQGAYKNLTTQSEGASEILLAVNDEGASKRVSEMSKGTRFQLYLALRAAAHKQMIAQNVRLPFFCDDIFETFDEKRTSAACQVMEQIGQSGQAIYLTHHRHVVDIAKEVCKSVPTVHEI